MLARLRSFAVALLRRRRLEDELSTEIRAHLDARTEDLVARGLAPGEAARRARLEFGAIEAVREECREARGLRWPDELARNVRFAIRLLRRNPAYSVASLATLALCVGANTAVFSVVDAVLLRSAPFPEAERLVMVGLSVRGGGADETRVSHTGRGWFAIREHATALEPAAFLALETGANLAVGGQAHYVRHSRVTAGFFRVLGVRPLLGREFTPDEDREGGPNLAVLSYRLWRRAFDGDPSVVGRSVLLRGEPYTVTGVMPRDLRTMTPAEVWTPLRPTTAGEGGGLNYAVLARLRPGVTWAQAEAQVRAVGEDEARHLRNGWGIAPDIEIRTRLIPFQRAASGRLAAPLLILWGAVAAVLVIGCVNVAGLSLALGAARRREVATRIALGGGRAAILRQLLTETFILAALGVLLGVLVGQVGVLALRRHAVEMLGIWQTVELNGRVLAATTLAALVTSVLFGIVPALDAARADVRPALGEGDARLAGGGSRLWPRRLLVAGEVALGCVLLVCAGLLVRTFANLLALQPGFDPHGVLTGKVSLLDARYRSSLDVNRLFDQSLARIRSLPGVESTAVGFGLPYERPLNMPVQIPGQAGVSSVDLFYVTPDYFRVLRVPILRGRGFGEEDAPGSPPVVIVNRAFARRYLSEAQAIGAAIRIADAPRTIVGVVGSVQQLAEDVAFATPQQRPAVYMPAAQTSDEFLQAVHAWFQPSWVVRSSGRPRALVAGLARAVEALDPLLPFARFETMDELLGASLRGQRFQAALVGSLAALALLLAAVGIYGLIASSVTVRTRELGIRMALGATAGEAVRQVAVQGIALSLAGIAAGCALAAAATRLLRAVLFGVSSTDALTFVAVAVGLLLTAAVASILPALRITRLNPAETLRHQ